jgi:hypothetical protein
VYELKTGTKEESGKRENRCLGYVKRLMLTTYIWTQLIGIVEGRIVAKEIKVIKKMVL